MQQHTAPAHHGDPLARGPWDTNVIRDASGAIAVGGTAQYVTPQPVHGYEVVNPDAAADLWVCDNGNPAGPNLSGSIRVAPNGGAYWTPDHWPPLAQRVSVYGPNTGQAFTLRFW